MRRGDVTLIIPNSHAGKIGVGLLQRLLRQAGISREEWLGNERSLLRREYCGQQFVYERRFNSNVRT